MNAEVFEKLLIDLYQVYNEDKLNDIERIVKQNKGREFDAIKTIYLKYNFKQSPLYNPNLGTDKQIQSLIEKYESGNMVLEDEKKEEEFTIVEDKKEELTIVENKMPFNITLKFNYESDDLIVPDLYNFLFVSIGQRLILKTKSGGLIGFEILDILDDYISFETPTREIVLERK